MKQFIKQHPWRLEIVPFIIFAIAVILPLVYRHDLMASAGSLPLLWPGLNNWWLHYALRASTTIGWWLIEIDSNDLWVRLEHEKKLNYWAPPGTALIALTGWFACRWRFGLFWAIVMITSAVLQTLIDRTRKYVSKGYEQNPASSLSIIPGEPFYYREDHGFLGRRVLGQAGGVAAMLGLCSAFGNWMPLLVNIPGTILINWSRTVFVITDQRISARCGMIIRLTIPLSHIEDCRIYDYQPLSGRNRGTFAFGTSVDRQGSFGLRQKIDGMLAIGLKPGSCLQVNTLSGTTYLLGMNRSEEVCRTISKIIATD